jgi:hypothetical protein
MMSMMDGGCGPFMMAFMGLGGLLGLVLEGSLIALVWVLIARLRRPAEPVR